MIATARLGGAQQRIAAARAYSHAVRAILADLAAAGHTPRILATLLRQRAVKRDLYVVFASDRGLCGSFNHNLVHLTLGAMDKHQADHLVLPIGRRGLQYFRRLNVPLTKGYTSVADDISYSLARAITSEARQLYTGGEVDEVFLVFSKYVNPLVQRPTLRRLLPLAPDEWAGPDPDRSPDEEHPARGGPPGSGQLRLYEYLPSSPAVLDQLIPRFLEAQVYWAAIQSKASEHGARLTAMGSATENAEDMLRQLTLSLHRARQTHITAELAEIVSGQSEADEV